MKDEKKAILVGMMAQAIRSGKLERFTSPEGNAGFTISREWRAQFDEACMGYKLKNTPFGLTQGHIRAYNATTQAAIRDLWQDALNKAKEAI